MGIASFVRRHPVSTYFGLAYVVSYGVGAVVEGPALLRGETPPKLDGLLLFPILIVGVALAGVGLTALVGGRAGLRDLRARLGRWRVGARWYAVLLLPPALILAVLLLLRAAVAPAFAPNVFPLGILFGLAPGFLEEIGWTGYAYPRMRAARGPLAAALLLGVLWGLWHLPVVDSLGAAWPHGASWPAFALAFVALVTAMRVLIAWVYCNTGSVLLAQLLHASSTGSLVMLGAARVSPAQEAAWYAIYAAVLWGVVAVVVAVYGVGLARGPRPAAAATEHAVN
jgi:membrane protease YdiL (CAAX protease family)